MLDPECEKEQPEKNKLSHERAFPSKWRAAPPYQDPLETVRIIDQFVIPQKDRPADSSTTEDQC